jgi:hypothetical protein
MRYPQGEERHIEIPKRYNYDNIFFPRGKIYTPLGESRRVLLRLGSAGPRPKMRYSVYTSRNIRHSLYSAIRHFKHVCDSQASCQARIVGLFTGDYYDFEGLI